MFDASLLEAAHSLLERLRQRGLTLATAESCTGGLVLGLLTAVPGSSDVVDGGFVSYSNDAKTRMLGVDPALIEAEGAVSEAVARAMAEGAIRHAQADLALSITGIAGPDGGSVLKPVGMVHFALAHRDPANRMVHRLRFFGERGRDGVREAAIRQGFDMIASAAVDYPVR